MSLKNSLLSFGILALTVTGRSEPVTIYLTNGLTMEVELVRVSPGGIDWRSDSDGAGSGTVPMNRIAEVDFQVSAEWEAAERAFDLGNYGEAFTRFQAIAGKKQANHHPVPGNRSTLALWEMIQCQIRLLDPKQVAALAEKLGPEISSLPPDYRKFPSELKCWIEAGRENWAEVIRLTSDLSSSGMDVKYLRAIALSATGETEAALDAFTAAYVLGYGESPEISKASLRTSTEILSSLADDSRKAELHAALKVYQDLYGNGSLWEGAPEEFVTLAGTDLEMLSTGVEEDPADLNPPPAELPPLDKRDWILAHETDPIAYVVDKGAFDSKDELAPVEKDGDLLFDGTKSMWKEDVSLKDCSVRIRAAFISENEDGIILNAGESGGGFVLFLKERQMHLAWSDSKRRVTTLPLGEFNPGEETLISVNVNTKKEVSAKGASVGNVPGLISSKEPVTVTVGSSGAKGNATGKDLPQFKGIISHLSLSVGTDLKKLQETELEMFGGKRVVLGVPVEETPEKTEEVSKEK